jgi:hypothetical protein
MLLTLNKLALAALMLLLSMAVTSAAVNGSDQGERRMWLRSNG